MWELDCEEGWMPKNWCFLTVVLEKTLESPLDCKEIQPVHSEGDQPWGFFGRNDVKAETPVLWPPHAKSWLIEKRLWCWEGLGARGEGDHRGWDGWMASLTRWMWVSVNSGVGDGQGGLACCDSWGRKESDTTEWLIWCGFGKWKFIFTSHSNWDFSFPTPKRTNNIPIPHCPVTCWCLHQNMTEHTTSGHYVQLKSDRYYYSSNYPSQDIEEKLEFSSMEYMT